MKNKFLKNCLALFVITLVAGISLAFVNEVTKEPIAKAQDKARLEAYEVVYPNAEFKVMDVLSHSETAGLGAKATEDEFKSQFIGKSANGINYTKNGASNDTEIDALSGATITSNAVCEAVDSALAVYNHQLKEVD